MIYAVLHETIYCEGFASNWAADRVGRTLTEFQWLASSAQNTVITRDGPLFFSGEMIFPFMFDIFPELEKLQEVADEIAKYPRWPDLYKPEQLVCNSFIEILTDQ